MFVFKVENVSLAYKNLTSNFWWSPITMCQEIKSLLTGLRFNQESVPTFLCEKFNECHRKLGWWRKGSCFLLLYSPCTDSRDHWFFGYTCPASLKPICRILYIKESKRKCNQSGLMPCKMTPAITLFTSTSESIKINIYLWIFTLMHYTVLL